MSRSGYNDAGDGDQWDLIRWRGQVASAVRGKRGQSFFKALIEALDAMPEKRLIANSLQEEDGDVCALGALGAARGVDLSAIDPEDYTTVAATFDIATPLVREVVFMNDEAIWRQEPESRWRFMRDWAARMVTK